MTQAPDHIHELTCHPATPAGVALSLTAQVHLSDQEWTLRYRLRGATASLRIPPAGPSGPADGLWQHTCFEAFVAAEGAPGYREFNFSPGGSWAAYRFLAERVRDPVTDTTQPILQVSTTADHLQLTARLPLTSLPLGHAWTLGLCAVIEEADGRLSYWALEHPKERPDFHHRDSQALRLAPP
ncbi:MAG: DOMON-like domain-containing protein [Hydrogenophaga sp.]|uniref:DOMON-like domain-containing protein n=1 Tax=Hydrogenophaga sp. TaxID=1904254 RepID=UPI003D0AA823